nr:choline/carnitine O-acyltransferase [Neobacillus notoginsengisoli]
MPSLNSTKLKLLEWIKPLVSVEQFQKTTEVIDRFFEIEGDGEKLQKKLQEFAQNRTGSWLAPFWDDLYLTHRNPLPYSSNFNILIQSEDYQNRYSYAEMAGKVSYFVTELYHAIIDEKVEPDTFRGKRLDMSQYNYFFRSIRIPRLDKDIFHAADFDKRNNHVVLFYRNNLYKVPVTNHEGMIYDSNEIVSAIEEAMKANPVEGTNVGVFTAANRDEAAKAYDMLRESKVNQEILDCIADSLVVISIDEDSNNPEDAIRHLMLNANNKYFDKTIQIILTRRCELGFNIEHCAVDGTSIAAVISHVNQGLKNDPLQPVKINEKPIVEKQKWDLDKEMVDLLNQFKQEYLQEKENYDLQQSLFTDFGAEEIKQMKLSPDAFFHMALQIAQYRTFGKFTSVYEPVGVRFFYEGRTECARATSMEKRSVVEALEYGNEASEFLYSLMQKASDAHSERIRDCQKGLGVERHMFGLEQIFYHFAEELGLKELPEIFKDEGYLTLRHNFLSTSGTVYDSVKYRMFGPVVENGHGIAYIIKDDSISINISSYSENKTEGKLLMEHLINALQELKAIAKKEVGMKLELL